VRLAYSLVRAAPWYRAQAFSEGLKKAGFEVAQGTPQGRPGDLLLIWNRYANWHDQAVRFEREGGKVVVAENGYLGQGGTAPKFDVHPGGPKPHHYYALGLGFHNDDSRVPAGGPERWAELGVELKPWRTSGGHVLVAANRSFGVPGRCMPPDWPQRAVERLRRATKREVRLRVHPGNNAPQRPLSEDLKGCWAVVVWTSSAGVHALAAGIPVFCEAPHWICKSAASSGSIDEPTLPERIPALQRMAHGQWQIQEIESGVPFLQLLQTMTK
jgi:hypothetical protein